MGWIHAPRCWQAVHNGKLLCAMRPCPFCEPDREPLIERALVRALLDAFPVSRGHALVVPKRHVASYFGCTLDERAALWQLVDDVREHLESKHKPAGFNV